eukprot:6213338-Pleurochrysis_carterae.AAC.2
MPVRRGNTQRVPDGFVPWREARMTGVVFCAAYLHFCFAMNTPTSPSTFTLYLSVAKLKRQ